MRCLLALGFSLSIKWNQQFVISSDILVTKSRSIGKCTAMLYNLLDPLVPHLYRARRTLYLCENAPSSRMFPANICYSLESWQLYPDGARSPSVQTVATTYESSRMYTCFSAGPSSVPFHIGINSPGIRYSSKD